jgi:osmotically-inducible protein OsmY
MAHQSQPTDRELQDKVMTALDSDPLDRTAIGVTVSHGVVTLLGRVKSRREAWLAEEVVYLTPGVLGIANELQIDGTGGDDDSRIAEAAVNALSWYRVVEPGTVKVIASNGYVTLTGLVSDMQQRGAAERAVRHLRGVRGVWNALKVEQPPTASQPEMAEAVSCPTRLP